LSKGEVAELLAECNLAWLANLTTAEWQSVLRARNRTLANGVRVSLQWCADRSRALPLFGDAHPEVACASHLAQLCFGAMCCGSNLAENP
jgi:hypothetical protein